MRGPLALGFAWGLLVASLVFVGSSWGTIGSAATTSAPFDTAGWKTDFSRHSVPLTQIVSGGPPKDGIPAIDRPRFVSAAAADTWLKPQEPVILVAHGGDTRAYPLEILIWHEIVNDTLGGMPVAITFCPLCHTAIAFDRRVGTRVLDFGTTGKLRFSDLVMYDRQTESWWQQATGTAIVGELTGTQLVPLPAQIVAWDLFKRAEPAGVVLSRDTGYRRPYGQNPYLGYDDVRSSPFLYRGPKDGRLPPMERVAAVSMGTQAVAYPFSVLSRVGVVNDTVAGTPIVVLFAPGVTSALDQESIAASRDVGTAGVFRRTVGGRVLRFARAGGHITDLQTGSTWSVLGRALAGPLAGTQLPRVVSDQPFWFAWAVFRPQTRIYQP